MRREGPKAAAGTVSSSEVSRAAILDAAAVEFAARGFTGARIEHIAKRSGYNKALVYRYYGDRDNLIREVLRRELSRRQAILDASPPDPGQALVHWFRATIHEDARMFMKLLQREALNDAGEPPVEAQARRRYYHAQVDAVRELQERGQLDDTIPADILFLAMQALIAWPAFFPQVARLAHGADASEPAFCRAWEQLLRRIAALLQPSPRES